MKRNDILIYSPLGEIKLSEASRKNFHFVIAAWYQLYKPSNYVLKVKKTVGWKKKSGRRTNLICPNKIQMEAS